MEFFTHIAAIDNISFDNFSVTFFFFTILLLITFPSQKIPWKPFRFPEDFYCPIMLKKAPAEVFFYSLRRASIGFKLAAFRAGR